MYRGQVRLKEDCFCFEEEFEVELGKWGLWYFVIVVIFVVVCEALVCGVKVVG